MNKTRAGQAVVLAVALVLISGAAAAQAAPGLTDPDQSFSGLLELINQQASAWAPRLRGYAFALFWGLAGIQFVWSLGQLVFKNAELGEVLGELVRQVMTIGFWLAFLMFSVDWCTAIVESFRQAGGYATGLGSSLDPGDLFTVGVQLATNMSQAGIVAPSTAVMLAISTSIVLLCFVFIAALMAVALVESYIVINAGVLFMGFAGASWTRDTTMSFVKYAISVGAKLFILTLLVGVVLSSAREWAVAYGHNDASMWTLVGLSLVCAYLCKSIPDLIQALISGASIGGGGAIGGIAAAGAAFGMAAMAAVKTAATGGLAAPAAAGAMANAANAAMGANAGSAAAGAAGRGMALMGSSGATGGSAAGASASEATAGLGGRFGSPAAASSGTSSAPPSPPAAGMGPSAPAPASTSTPSMQAGDAAQGSDQAANSDPADETGDGQQDSGSTLGRIAGAMAHSGKAGWALAAMTTPGVDATPDASALMTPGGGAPTPDEADTSPADVTADQPANVIRPEGPGGTGATQTPPRASPPPAPPKE